MIKIMGTLCQNKHLIIACNIFAASYIVFPCVLFSYLANIKLQIYKLTQNHGCTLSHDMCGNINIDSVLMTLNIFTAVTTTLQ